MNRKNNLVAVFVLLLQAGCLREGTLTPGSVPTEPETALVDPELAALNCKRLDLYWEKVQQKMKDRRAWEIPVNATTDSAPVLPAAEGEAVSASAEGSGQKTTIVSEADFVKADRDLFFLVRPDTNRTGAIFYAFGVKETGEILLLDSVELEGVPQEFLYDGQNALVIARETGPGSSYGTLLHRISVRNPGELAVTGSLILKNQSYVTSRLVGGTAHLVVEHTVPFWIEESPTVDLVFAKSQPLHDGGPEVPITSCGCTFVPDEVLDRNSGQNVITVLSLPIRQEQFSPKGHSVITASGQPIVSVGANALYIGVSSSWGSDSEIFKFSLNQGDDVARFAAKGEVPGRLETAFQGGGYNSQFSMDEHAGYLRVATTTGALWWGGEAESSLFVLAEEGRELKVVGELRDLHHGEAVYAVRFIGDKGYVVTFKKIDPLFVVDLSDPTRPQLSGQLEVPGFSTFLMPLGNDRILGIGKEADDQGDFAWYLGLKLSLFDVSNPSSPALVQSVTIGERGTESEALTDHRAFSTFPERNLIAFPVDLVTEISGESDMGWRPIGNPDHSEEQIWKVDQDAGFSRVGAIRHDDLSGDSSDKICDDLWECPFDGTRMRRAFEANGFLITLSESGLKAHSFDDFETVRGLFQIPIEGYFY